MSADPTGPDTVPSPKNRIIPWMAVGAVLGATLGAVLDEMGLGLALGLAAGLIVGALLARKDRKNNP
jgi:ABC-type nitrate/sulfonate/bicarbonate transport system permease component